MQILARFTYERRIINREPQRTDSRQGDSNEAIILSALSEKSEEKCNWQRLLAWCGSRKQHLTPSDKAVSGSLAEDL